MADNLDTLLEELSSFKLPEIKKPNIESAKSELTEDNVESYLLKRTEDLIDTGIGAIEDLRDYIVQGQNPDEISALSELINSTTKSLEILSKINAQNKKIKADKELKTIDAQIRKEVANTLPGNSIVNNTNILVASREEIFKKLLTDTDDNIIETTVIEDK
jgi:hypothetical protein